MKAPSSFTKPEGTNVYVPAVVQHDCYPAGTIEELYTPPSGCELTETYVGTAYDKVAVVADNIEEVIKVATMIGTGVASLVDSILIQLGHNIAGSFELGATVTKPTDYVTFKSEPYHYIGSVFPYEVSKLSEPNSDFEKGYRGSVSDWDAFDEVLLAYAGLAQTGTPDTTTYSYRLDALRKLGLSRAWKSGGEVTSTNELLRYGLNDYVATFVPVTMGESPVGDSNFQRYTVTMDDVVPGVVDIVKQYRDECKAFSTAAGNNALSAEASAQKAMDEAARAMQYTQDTETLRDEVIPLHQEVVDTAAIVASDKNDITTMKDEVATNTQEVSDKHSDVVSKTTLVNTQYADILVKANEVDNKAANVTAQIAIATDAANRSSSSATAASDSADRASVSASNANTFAVAADAAKVISETNADITIAKATEATNAATAANASATSAGNSATNASQSATESAASAQTAVNAVNEIGSAVSDSQAAATQAALSATAAAESERNAEIYKTASEAAKLAADTSVTQAQGFANSASASATTATTKAGEASANATIATDAKDAAKVSETNAATFKTGAEQARDVAITKSAEALDSANKAKDVLDTITTTTLSIYRGTWDPEVTQAYPDNKGTSSQWDVSIASDTAVTFDGKEWKSGYRLVYSKPDNIYSRIVMESGVSSIDGKTGAVDLSGTYASKSVETTKADKATTYTKTEVDANKVSKSGDTMTGSLNITNGLLRVVNTDGTSNHLFENSPQNSVYRVDNPNGWKMYMGLSNKFVMHMDTAGNLIIPTTITEGSARVYSPNNKPTWSDVGGDTYLQKVAGNYLKAGSWIQASADTSGFLPNQKRAGSTAVSYIGRPDWWFKESWVNSYRGGVMDLSGKAAVTGLRVKRNATSTNGDDVMDIVVTDITVDFIHDNQNDGQSGAYRFFKKDSAGNNVNLMLFDSHSFTYKGKKVYHVGNKPSWADVGGNSYWSLGTYITAQSGKWIQAANNATGFIPYSTGNSSLGTSSFVFKESWVNTYRGNGISVTGTMETASNLALKQTNSGTSAILAAMTNVADGGIRYINWGAGLNILSFTKTAVDGSGNAALVNVHGKLTEKGQRVYSPNNKPTPQDIGAPASYYNVPDGTDLFEYLKTAKPGFYRMGKTIGNKPTGSTSWMDMIVVEHGTGYRTAIIMDGDTRMWQITITPTGVVGGGWKKIYSETQKPTADDVNAVSSNSQVLKTSTDWNTLDTTAFYNVYKNPNTVFDNAPTGASYGTLQVIGRGKDSYSYATQVFTDKITGVQWIRTRNDGTFVWYPWKRIYSEAFKPTAADIGALPSNGKAADSDKLDGLDSASFLRSDVDDSVSGKIIASSSTRQAGMYGTYDPNKITHIWSVGAGYTIANGGADFGNLYGFAHKYSNTSGGTMAGGQQAVWCINGIPQVALGTNIWAKNKIYEQGTLLETRYLGLTAKAADSAKLNGVVNSSGVTADTIVQRDSSGDIQARLFRSNYQNQTGAIPSTAAFVYRTNNSSDNYLRFTTDKVAIRTFLDIEATPTIVDLGTF